MIIEIEIGKVRDVDDGAIYRRLKSNSSGSTYGFSCISDGSFVLPLAAWARETVE